MMINITTPALLFPAISLLLLAYTNRFLVLAQLTRQLHAEHQEKKSDANLRQILNLRKRIQLIRVMQLLGVLSFTLCALAMFALFVNWMLPAEVLFGLSLLGLILSLLFSLVEIAISTDSLNIALEDLEQHAGGPGIPVRGGGREPPAFKE